MSTRVHFFLFGGQALPESDDEITWSSASTEPLVHASAERLAEITARAEEDYPGFIPAERSADVADIHSAVEKLDRDPQLETIIIAPRCAADPFPLFAELPLPAALAVRPPELSSAILFRRTALTQSGIPFRNVDLPIWDRLMQTAHNSTGAIAAIPSSGVEERDGFAFPGLAPGSPGHHRQWLFEHLDRLDPQKLIAECRSPDDAVALKSGLLLIHDYLEESHDLSQSVQGKGRHAAGDYWHGIMHRREPDNSNAKYWFRRVGDHPVFPELAEAARPLFEAAEEDAAGDWKDRCLSGPGWDPFAFIDFCSFCRRGANSALAEIAEQIQYAEMLLLLRRTARDASA